VDHVDANDRVGMCDGPIAGRRIEGQRRTYAAPRHPGGGGPGVDAGALAGALSDRIGRRPVAGVSYLLIALLIYPAFLLINASPTLATLLSVVAVLAALNAAGGAPSILTLTEIFPTEVRATGMSLVYALGVAIFGGFGQFIVTWLIQALATPIAPAYYVIGCCISSLIALSMLPEMARKQLT
jgi:MFS transporter, MHS family, proline/betaine transporter